MGFKEGLSYIVSNAEQLGVSQEDLKSFYSDLDYYRENYINIVWIKEQDLNSLLMEIKEYLFENRTVFISSVADLVGIIQNIVGDSFEIIYKSTHDLDEVEGGIAFGSNLILKVSNEKFYSKRKNVWRITYYFKLSGNERQLH